jgi:hypothetical protein
VKLASFASHDVVCNNSVMSLNMRIHEEFFFVMNEIVQISAFNCFKELRQ